MKILVIGKGGREHALAYACKRSALCDELICAPGNPGMAKIGECVDVKDNDVDGLVTLAKERNVDLTIVGPEATLALGVVDAFKKEGLKIFGPDKKATQVESSKDFAKKIMAKYNKKTYSCAVTVKNKSVTKPDPYDGDTNYPVSFAYTERDNSITYGKVKYDTYFSTTTNKMRTCAIILPPNYDKNKAYPVCYLLHGLGQDHTDWLNANADTIIGNMIAAKTAREMILVLPNCRARANDTYVADQFSLDNYRAFDNFINDLRDNLMPYIKENYSVAEGRENTAIAGFSMGGRTALYIGLSMQDTFGYIGGFCPAPGLFAYEMNGIAEDGLFKTDTFKLNDEYADNTLLMIVAAKNDTVVFDIPETYHNALVKNNTKHIWYKTTGGHDATVMDHGFYNFAKRLFNN